MDSPPDPNDHSRRGSDPAVRSTPSRRSFLRTFAAGLAVAVPAFGALANAQPAAAAGRCDKTYWVYQGHYCQRYDNCPAGNTANCIGVYYIYSSSDGGYCRTETDNEGRCRGS